MKRLRPSSHSRGAPHHPLAPPSRCAASLHARDEGNASRAPGGESLLHQLRRRPTGAPLDGRPRSRPTPRPSTPSATGRAWDDSRLKRTLWRRSASSNGPFCASTCGFVMVPRHPQLAPRRESASENQHVEGSFLHDRPPSSDHAAAVPEHRPRAGVSRAAGARHLCIHSKAGSKPVVCAR